MNKRITVLLFLLAAGHSSANPLAAFQTSEGGIIRGAMDRKEIALVFTGHSFAEGGETILDELTRHQAKASFFLTGDFLVNSNFSVLVRRMVREGHLVGPHSDKHLLYCPWDGPKTNLVSREEFCADLAANLEKLERFGVPRTGVRYFLPPFEFYNQAVSDWSAALGLTVVNFTPGTRANADYMADADKSFVSSQAIFDSVLRREQGDPQGLNGFILLFHLGAGPERTDKFSARFGQLLDALTSKGYRLVRVDELLAPKLEQVFIRASQVGYAINGPKLAVAFSALPLPEEFLLVAEEDERNVVFRGRPRPLTNAVWGRFEHHAELDFSAVQTPGSFCLKLGGFKSLPVKLNVSPDRGMVPALLEFMREQRCGYNPWLGTNCHQLDGRTAFGPLTNATPLDARGGWHDAGDLLKYLLTSGNATAQMLLAHQMGSKSGEAADQFDALGNPGTNGIPDLLDEARWGLEWMLKLHPTPDALYHQVADDRDHAGWRLPHQEITDYGWGKGGARVVYFADGRPQGLSKYQSASTGVANLAGRYAAAMALAYQIWRDDSRHQEFARRCLQAGREVYALGQAREGVQQGNSFGAPYRYEETTWADDMEWGAAELLRATGETSYLADAKRYAQLAGVENWMGRDQTGHYQYYPFMNAGHIRLYDVVDADFKKLLAGYYRTGIDRCVTAAEANPYQVGVPFIWCSDNLVVALATQCAMYERMTGDIRYRTFAAKQCEWLLGRNPWGVTMFTGIGREHPRDVHLMTTHLTHRSVRGGLVDGPVYERIFKSLKGISIREPDPLALFQGPAVYHDDVGDYSTNEPTMDGTAAAILLFVLLEQ